MLYISSIFGTIYGFVHIDIFHVTYLYKSYFTNTWVWILVLVLEIGIWNDIPLRGMVRERWPPLGEGVIYPSNDRHLVKGHKMSSDDRHLAKEHKMSSDDRH